MSLLNLKDKLKAAIQKGSYEFVPVVKKELTSEQLRSILVSEVSDTVIAKKREFRPRVVVVNSMRQTEQSYECESCDKKDILFEVGKLLLCGDCRKKELEAHVSTNGNGTPKDTTKDNGVWQASIDTLKKPEVPQWAKAAEDRYFEFFNRDTLYVTQGDTIVKKDYEIEKLTDEELRDAIISDGEILFEVKVKQQKKVITYNERIAKKSAEERKKLQLNDLTYKPEDPIEASPVEEIRKRRNKEEQAKDSLAKLGLDLSDFAKKFKIK